MILYLLKFSLVLGILLLFYKLFLERDTMHVLKRFYLLGSLLFALIIPGLVFTEFVILESFQDSTTPSTPITQDGMNVPKALESDILDMAPLLWGIYFIGLICFGLNFIRQLVQVFLRIKNNPKEKDLGFTQVLLRENLPPHTFFHYIFLNQAKLESREIPKDVLLHEQTHAKERHSMDVLFVEILKVLLWFNPLLYIIRNSIKLNHEFLADHAVLKGGTDPKHYQNTLLSFIVPTHPDAHLANAINYTNRNQCIQKRFIIMKTQTRKQTRCIKMFLILPMISLLLYGFAEKRVVPIYQENASQTQIIPDQHPKAISPLQEGASPEQLAEYNALARKYNAMLEAKGNIFIQKSEVDRLEYLYGIMTTEQRESAEPFPEFPEPPKPPAPPSPPQQE